MCPGYRHHKVFDSADPVAPTDDPLAGGTFEPVYYSDDTPVATPTGVPIRKVGYAHRPLHHSPDVRQPGPQPGHSDTPIACIEPANDPFASSATTLDVPVTVVTTDDTNGYYSSNRTTTPRDGITVRGDGNDTHHPPEQLAAVPDTLPEVGIIAEVDEHIIEPESPSLVTATEHIILPLVGRAGSPLTVGPVTSIVPTDARDTTADSVPVHPHRFYQYE